MLYLERARREARELRRLVGLDPEGLYDRLLDYLWKGRPKGQRIEVVTTTPEKLRGGRAEVKPGYILYDENLDKDPAMRLRVIAHEVGHVLRHDRLHRYTEEQDPTTVGTYAARENAAAIARYSRRSREEAEAEAFAVEFTCPSDDVFERWQSDPAATSRSIAECLGLPVAVVRAQLAEALYRLVDDPGGAQSGRSGNVGLDEHQALAASHRGTPALVDAGPGCGKTATLVERVTWLIEQEGREGGATPEEAARRILVLTFSTEAASELENRLVVRLRDEVADKVTVATFHGFCRHVLHVHGHPLKVNADAPILDDAAQEAIVFEALGHARCERLLNLSDPEGTATEAARHINFLKQRMVGTGPDASPWTPETLRHALDELKSQQAPDEENDLADAYALSALFEVYERKKREAGKLDFADLISLTLSLLRDHGEVAAAYRKRYRHVLVDEFQDVSRAVSRLLGLLCGPENPPWVVGDARQAIYQFLNAAPENVRDFESDFARAEVFSLRNNYRSCPEVVTVANQLATLIERPSHTEPGFDVRWIAASPVTPLSDPAVIIAVANSDAAEHDSVADQVVRWVEQGIPLHDIAVLARRNIDVRNIVLALGRRGIRATASGMLTPEGAAGDLATVVTLMDGPGISLTRLAYALGRGRYEEGEIDAAIVRLLEWVEERGRRAKAARDGGVMDELEPPPEEGLFSEVARVYVRLLEERFTADGFGMMAAFLFDASDYLRRLLGAPSSDSSRETRVSEGDPVVIAEVAASLKLAEVMTSLSRAAGYRFTHPEEDVRDARLRFGAYFRRRLNDASPTAIAPRRVDGSVQVMTCHAAKGLEFPCVIVTGQTLSQASGEYAWLPPQLQPPEAQDREQADALLFVGATRAQRALVVSYAESASGAAKSRPRERTPLLSRWVEVYQPAQIRWPDQQPSELLVSIAELWGRRDPVRLSAQLLHESWCPVRTYVEQIAKLRFPEAESPVYPRFYEAVRFTLGMVVRLANERGRSIGEDEAAEILRRVWRSLEAEQHPHLALYSEFASAFVMSFVQEYKPLASAHRKLDLRPLIMKGKELRLELGIVAAFLQDDDVPAAIVFRPESYGRQLDKSGTAVKWSGVAGRRRLPLVLLHGAYPGLRAFVYSGLDGRLYPFSWSQKATSMDTERSRAEARLEALRLGAYHSTINIWECDRCRSRLACPFWMRSGSESAPVLVL